MTHPLIVTWQSLSGPEEISQGENIVRLTSKLFYIMKPMIRLTGGKWSKAQEGSAD